MRATGVVRKLDSLGRIVIPMELRRTWSINVGDAMEIFVDGESVILKKYIPGCVICSDTKDVRLYREKLVCAKCVEELNVKG